MIAFLKLSPVLFLAALMMISNIEPLSSALGFSLDILVIAPIATVYAAAVAVFTEKFKVSELIDTAVENVKEMQLVFFILMLAYALADVFMSAGVGASIINMSLKLGLSAKTVAVAAFLVSSVLSVATGTSWGTFAACAPIFIWMTHILGGNIVLSIAAIAGGACFGDNLGLISDTTVVSSGIHRVELTDRIKNQGAWSVLCLVLAAVLFYIGSMHLPSTTINAGEAINAIPKDVWTVLSEKRPVAISLLEQVRAGVPMYMVIPLILVIFTAVIGMPTLVCLFLGLISSLILGLAAGTISSVMQFLETLQGGFSESGKWVIVMMMWVGAFGGIMGKMDAFRPLSNLAIRMSKNVAQLLFFNGLISIIGNAALADEMAQIVTIGPIIDKITTENVAGHEKEMYTLRLRNASFSSALGVFGSQLIPWHVYLSFFVSIASAIYPLHEFKAMEIVTHNYMAIIAVVSVLVLTLTKLDRFIPGFKTASEPAVRLAVIKDIEELKSVDSVIRKEDMGMMSE